MSAPDFMSLGEGFDIPMRASVRGSPGCPDGAFDPRDLERFPGEARRVPMILQSAHRDRLRAWGGRIEPPIRTRAISLKYHAAALLPVGQRLVARLFAFELRLGAMCSSGAG
jgi:hypothetical protein